MPENDGTANFLMLIPMLGAATSMTLMMLFRGSALAAIGALMMIVTVIAFIIMFMSNRGRSVRRRQSLRDRYLTYLDRQSSELYEAEQERARLARTAEPHPGALLSLVRSTSRLWERRRDDQDFMRLRLGIGFAPSVEFERVGEDNAMSLDDEFMSSELDRVEERFSTMPDAPVTVPFDSVGNVSIVGDQPFCRRIAVLLTSHAAALSSPEDIEMALTYPEGKTGDYWKWMTWLPHMADQDRATHLGPIRRIAKDEEQLAEVLRPELHRRLTAAAQVRRNRGGGDISSTMARMWVVSDHHGEDAIDLPLGDREVRPSDVGVTMLHLLASREHEPDDITLRISPSSVKADEAIIERYEKRDKEPERINVKLDEFTHEEAQALARYLSGVRLAPDSLEHDEAQQAMRASDLLGVEDLTNINLEEAWAPRPRSSFLRVQIGTDDQGAPVMLDLKESAQYGMGPHGLAIGATGSGKSELLRTLVLGLVAGHSPSDVNMVLVDYKGGAAFAPFENLPHVAGVITNLGDDANLVERVYASLEGEVKRRQQLLKDAGSLSDITTYRRRQAAEGGENMEPLPHLLVIIDEFGELLTARPDFIDLFLSIGRIGRSIGVHLLLSSQRIEGGKLRGLDTYLSYRIGLRTLSAAESRTVIDTVDAFSLPPLPGYGYLKVDTTTYTKFRAGYVSGLLPKNEEDIEVENLPHVSLIDEFAVLDREEQADKQATPGGADDEDEEGDTVLSTVVAQLEKRPRVTRPIWLDPLEHVLTLDQAAGKPMATRRGLRITKDKLLRIPIGMIDDPAHQWQGKLNLDLAGPGGHVFVVGAPRSGKTTVLQTIAASLALTHPSAEAIVYGVDLLGSGLMSIEKLPNVAGVATRQRREAVRRTIEEVQSAMQAREMLLHQSQMPDLETVRRLAGNEVDSKLMSEIVLLVDGFGQFNEEFNDLEENIKDIVRRGAGLGVHVVATGSRLNDARLSMQTYFGNRLELRLTDPGESSVARKLSATISADRPGQCLTSDGLFGQIALPRIDSNPDRGSTSEGLSALVKAVSEATTDRAPKVRLLPQVVTPDMVEKAESKNLIPIGLYETQLNTAQLDVSGTDWNVVAIGANKTGRTSMLKYLAREMMKRWSPEELVFAVFDPRRGLSDLIPEPYLGGYASSATLAEKLVKAIIPELQKRVPGTAESEENNDSQPRIVLLIDDYDVLTAGNMSPLQALQPFLAMGPEINLSAIIARRVAGASRGLFEPVFNTVRESGATGFMFSGDRTEGLLLGGERARKLPTGRARMFRTGQPGETVQLVCDEPDEDLQEARDFERSTHRTGGGSAASGSAPLNASTPPHHGRH
ncbi:type VII secretion protein EccCa [Dermabacter vaginalis]|uniref:Type VII secretion protein EccCa n=1 Tax=Dermabacter vaginalis TaxID=1630135 RepID=A0A1B0ZFC5_9MICO|nr:type VII secretion protein EccCa [Dermabacter vaginalis]